MTNQNETQIEQLSLFDSQNDETEHTSTSALPESATVEWKNFYDAIADYAKRLKPVDK